MLTRRILFFVFVVLYPLAVIGAYVYCAANESGCKTKKEEKDEHQAEERKTEIARLIAVQKKAKSSSADQKPEERKVAPRCSGVCDSVKHTLDDPVALFTMILSYFVLLQVYWVIRQEEVLRESVNASRKAAQAAVGSQLPVIAFSGAKLIGYDENGRAMKILDPLPHGELPSNMLRALFCLRNAGKTTAAVLRFSIRWQVAPELPPGPPEPIYGHMAVTNNIIEAEDDLWFVYERDPIVLSKSQLVAVNSGSSTLWVYGFFAYADFMEDIHTIGFCYRWEVKPLMGDQPRGLIPDGPSRYRYQTHHQKEEKNSK